MCPTWYQGITFLGTPAVSTGARRPVPRVAGRHGSRSREAPALGRVHSSLSRDLLCDKVSLPWWPHRQAMKDRLLFLPKASFSLEENAVGFHARDRSGVARLVNTPASWSRRWDEAPGGVRGCRRGPWASVRDTRALMLQMGKLEKTRETTERNCQQIHWYEATCAEDTECSGNTQRGQRKGRVLGWGLQPMPWIWDQGLSWCSRVSSLVVGESLVWGREASGEQEAR